jgi:hypothetical protein
VTIFSHIHYKNEKTKEIEEIKEFTNCDSTCASMSCPAMTGRAIFWHRKI